MSFEDGNTGTGDELPPSPESVPVTTEGLHQTPVDDLTGGHEQALLSVVAPQIDGLPAEVAADVLAHVEKNITPEQRGALETVGKFIASIRGLAKKAAASFV